MRNVSVTEDFSPATRLVRKKLVQFAKSQPNSPSFKLKYNRLLLNDTYYSYDPVTDTVLEAAMFRSHKNDVPEVTAAPSDQIAVSPR